MKPVEQSPAARSPEKVQRETLRAARWLSALSTLLILGLAPTGARATCDLSRPDPRLVVGADAWLETMPPKITESLRRKGFAFQDPTRLDDCPGMVPAIVIFGPPPETVFSLLIQTERHAEFMKSLAEAVPVSRAPDPHVDRQAIKILFTRITYHVRHRWDSLRWRIWWDLSPDHASDLRAIGGYWELHPISENRTLGLYGTYVDVGPVIPRRLQASLTRKNLRAAVENIRTWVNEQGGNRR